MFDIIELILLNLCLFFLGHFLSFSLFKIVIKGGGNTRKAISKVKKEYPYFTYPWYKRMFFLGLNGKMPKWIIVLAFAYYILSIVLAIVCVIYFFYPIEVIDLLIRIIAGTIFVLIPIDDISLVFLWNRFSL